MRYIANDALNALNAWGEKNLKELTDEEKISNFATSDTPIAEESWHVIPGFPSYEINIGGIVRDIETELRPFHWVTLWNDERQYAENLNIDELVRLAFPPEPANPKIHIEVTNDMFNAVITPKMTKPSYVSIVICKHCHRAIEFVNSGYVHIEGDNRGKSRCDPQDSQLIYGYNADPVGVECTGICLGAMSK